jgi:putative membrane protein
MFPYYSNHWGSNGGFYSFPFSNIVSWIFFIVAIFLIIRLFQDRHHDSINDQNNKTALDILKERYAKGEINKKEFLEMKKDLE